MMGTAGSETAREQLRKPQQTREFQGRTLLILGAAVGLSTGMTATMFYSLGAFIPSLQAQFGWARGDIRSEEHTSELQSLMRISYAVFCLKKKNNSKPHYDQRAH